MKAKFDVGDIVKTNDGKVGKISSVKTVGFYRDARKCYKIKGSTKCYYSYQLKRG